MRKHLLTLSAAMLAGLGVSVVSAPGALAQEQSGAQPSDYEKHYEQSRKRVSDVIADMKDSVAGMDRGKPAQEQNGAPVSEQDYREGDEHFSELEAQMEAPVYEAQKKLKGTEALQGASDSPFDDVQERWQQRVNDMREEQRQARKEQNR